MPSTLYYMSGSPYAWRAWLALEHKRIPYALKVISYDAGDLSQPEFIRLNPRQKVPVLVDGDFALYESAAIVEYAEDRQPGDPRLFAVDLHHRAVQRRMVREADQYLADALERLVVATLFTPPERRDPSRIAEAAADIRRELTSWEAAAANTYLSGELSAVDFTVFPQVALVQRIEARNPGLLPADLIGANVLAWTRRMEALPITQKTWPPHWKG